MNDALVVIDLSSLAYPLWHLSGSEPDPNWTSTQIVAKIRALASAHPHVAICCDSGKSFRADISADYKATRPERDATLQHQISVAVDTLHSDGFPIWAVRGYEADDVIATAVAAAQPPDSAGAAVLIISADKDLLQLVSDRVQVFRPAVGTAPERTYDAAAVVEKFGVEPQQFVDFLALVGDKSDNIAGAKGIGAVIAAKLLATYGTLEDLWAAMERGEASLTPALGKSLIDFFAGTPSRCDLARQLIRLKTDAPIPFEEIFQERVPADVATFGDDIDFAMPTVEPHVTPTLQQAVDRLPLAQAVQVERAVDSIREAATASVDRPSTARGTMPSVPNGADSGPLVPPSSGADGVEHGGGDAGAGLAHPRGRLAPVEWERQLEPQDIAQAKELSTWMFQSRLFSAYGTPQAVLATVLAGRELGFQAMASLRAFHILEGRPTLSAGAIHALILQSGKAKYFRCTERTPTQATFVTQRGEDPPVSLSFTVEEARQAWSREPTKFAQSGWGKNPADMCVARALTKLARLVYPDIVSGLYASEEFDQ